jgi:hypothetical protein
MANPASVFEALKRAHAAGALRDRHVEAITRVLNTPATDLRCLTITRDGHEIGRLRIGVRGSEARILWLSIDESGERLSIRDVRKMADAFLKEHPHVEDWVSNRWRGFGRPTKPVRLRARSRFGIGANGGPPLED